MKNFTLPKAGNLTFCLAVLTLLLLGACSSPQHFSFSPAPPAYLKPKPQAVVPAALTTPPASAATITASTTAVPTLLPEVAALKAAAKAKPVTAHPATAAPETKQSQQKLTLAQKVVLKKLQKQATKLEQKTKRSLDTTAGPVSNRSAIALILIGLVLAIFGALLGPIFYTLGTLLILVGLVLLILNYI